MGPRLFWQWLISYNLYNMIVYTCMCVYQCKKMYIKICQNTFIIIYIQYLNAKQINKNYIWICKFCWSQHWDALHPRNLRQSIVENVSLRGHHVPRLVPKDGAYEASLQLEGFSGSISTTWLNVCWMCWVPKLATRAARNAPPQVTNIFKEKVAFARKVWKDESVFSDVFCFATSFNLSLAFFSCAA